MKNQVFLYLFFMLVFVGCQKFESMEDFDALFTHKKCHILSEAEWQKLVQLCNDTWDGFTISLQDRYPQLTERNCACACSSDYGSAMSSWPPSSPYRPLPSHRKSSG